MKESGLRTWAFPSICFILFLYVMSVVLVYTYNRSFGAALIEQQKGRGEIDPEAVRREIMKLKLN